MDVEGITGAVEGLTVEGITGAGGKMIPQLVAGLSAVYQAGRMYDSVRYWNDYYKNTGYRPKYPLRNDVYGFGRGVAIFGKFGNANRKFTVNRYITNRNTYHYDYTDYRTMKYYKR